MPTTTDPVPRSRRRPPAQDFLELAQRVKDAGLMDRRLGRYAARAALLAGGFAVAVTLLLTLGRTPWQLAVAVLFTVLFTQTAFLGHDAAHQQVFASGRHNDRLSRVVSNLIVGLSHGWWVRKHNRHHANPNTIGRDEDIATGALVFDPTDVPGRAGALGWITRRQGWLFFPMLTLEGINLHVSAVQTVTRRAHLRGRRTEAAFIAVRLIGFPVLVVVALGPLLGVAFLAVHLMTFGLYLGSTFAPNHKGMPLVPKDTTVDFLRRQVVTSRNIRGGRAVTWAMGGLNHQVEHHLFPRMPSVNLRRARPIVREFCDERNVPYTETGLFAAYRIVIRYLNRVGLGHADPFECPLVSQHRPR